MLDIAPNKRAREEAGLKDSSIYASKGARLSKLTRRFKASFLIGVFSIQRYMFFGLFFCFVAEYYESAHETVRHYARIWDSEFGYEDAELRPNRYLTPSQREGEARLQDTQAAYNQFRDREMASSYRNRNRN